MALPFRCPYCGGLFCVAHRLPESHECPGEWKAGPPSPEEVVKVEVGALRRAYRIPLLRPALRPRRILYFGPKEPLHFFVGMLLVVLVGISFFLGRWAILHDVVALVGLLTIFVLAFAIHELSHKFAAQLYGLWAEFRTNISFALITLLSVLLPFKILAPGAVVISGPVTVELGGKTALAGPLANVAMSIAIYLLALITPFHWLFDGAMINAFLAFFNLLPFFVFDGQKVLAWDKAAWALAFVASSIVMLGTYLDGRFSPFLLGLATLCFVLAIYRMRAVKAVRYPYW